MDPSPHRGSSSHHPLPSDNDRIANNNSTSDQNPQRVRFAEGEPQASYKIYQPTPKRGKPPPAGPAVYWDDRETGKDIDRESDANLVGYTFYREGTPTPPDYEVPEKRLGHGGVPLGSSSTAGGGTIGGGTYIGSERTFGLGPHDRNGNSNWSVADSNEMSSRSKRKLLWILIAVGILVVIGIAVGLGVGLSVGKSNGDQNAVEAAGGPTSSSSPPASDPTPESTQPPTATPGGTQNAADRTGPADDPRPTYNSDCPALNNTIYHVPGSTKSYKRLCGIDYSGSGATDLAHAWTESMADCMHMCASFDQCTACAWGYLPGDQGSKHRCYMKKDLKQSHKAAADWCFAILQ